MADEIKIWGHRGCKGEHNPPENSIAAFKEAIKQGADGFELDVFVTKDNHLVVFHDVFYDDDTLERMTNGKGKIADYTFEELRRLRLKDAQGQLTDLQIPTLEEVLDVTEEGLNATEEGRKKKPEFTVNIEIMRVASGPAISHRHVADAIRRRFDQGWQPKNFQVSSYDMNSLREMRKACPAVPIGALFEDPKEPWDISEESLRRELDEIKDLRPDTVNISLPSMTPEAVRMIRSSGAKPVAWTCGEINPELQDDGGRAMALRIRNSGLHAMITDYPREMRALLERFPAKSAEHGVAM